MNIERINQLADDLDKIENEAPSAFNMSIWGYDMLRSSNHSDNGIFKLEPDERMLACNTAGCIAGWATFLYAGQYESYPREFAIKYLELLPDDAYHLLSPEPRRNRGGDIFEDGVIYRDITASKAATVLRLFAKTGRVDWTIVAEPRS